MGKTRQAGPAGHLDFIAHGGTAHAAFLGITECTAEEAEAEGLEFYQSRNSGKGYRLLSLPSDMFRVTDPAKYERWLLRQKVSTIETPLVMPQSDDPRSPGYAPAIMDYETRHEAVRKGEET